MLSRREDIDSRTRSLAYSIWEREGRPEGRAVEHWLRAVAEIKYQHPRSLTESDKGRGATSNHGAEARRSRRSSGQRARPRD